VAEFGADGGWTESAKAWIEAYASGKDDPNRTLLLDPVMLELAGDVAGQRVLDLGCGEGRFCRMMAARGATAVGLDLIEAMIVASRANAGANERYVIGAGDHLPFAGETFDLLAVYLVLIDIEDFRGVIREAARVLRPGGRLLVANMNFATAALLPSWQRDEAGRRLFMRLDNYAEERSRILEWEGMRIRNWHRPLSAYMDAYLSAGLILRSYLEPVPTDESLRNDDYFEDWFRVPIFDVMLWEKAT
jgi:SAM-dependent methyltransferase